MDKETKGYMERLYAANDSDKPVRFFIGKEIENTAFKDLNTLFIVGNQTIEAILDSIERAQIEHNFKVEHIYFAANHSYDVFENFEQLATFISMGYKTTYENTNTNINEELLSKLPIGNNNFVFMVSVVLPNINTMLSNVSMKIDDKDVNRTNPGVWCYSLASLLLKEESTKSFTSWQEYSGDIILD